MRKKAGSAALTGCGADGDAASNLLERRWFASIAAVRVVQAECEVLGEVTAQAEQAWQRARRQLARLEALRDALAEELADGDGQEMGTVPVRFDRTVSSAA